MSKSKIFDNIAKTDRSALNWIKIKKINSDDIITWFAKNIKLIDYDVNCIIDFKIKTRN